MQSGPCQCLPSSQTHRPGRIKLAQLYTAVGEHRKSPQLVNEVIELEPYNARAYFIKGLNIRDLQKDTLQAIQYFQKAVDLDNTYIDAMDMLGVLYAAKKNPLAVAYYQNILALDPNRSDVYYKLGVYYMDIKDWNKSLEAYTKAVQLNPKDVDSYFNLGLTFAMNKEFDKAIKTIRQFRKIAQPEDQLVADDLIQKLMSAR